MLCEGVFGLGEASNVLDREDGLLRECLDQRGLVIRERPDSETPKVDDSDGSTILEERHGENAPRLGQLQRLARIR